MQEGMTKEPQAWRRDLYDKDAGHTTQILVQRGDEAYGFEQYADGAMSQLFALESPLEIPGSFDCDEVREIEALTIVEEPVRPAATA